MDEKIRVGITHGDYNGVGYEVIVKALAADGIIDLMTPVIFCDRKLFDRACKEAGVQFPKLNVVFSAQDAADGVVNIVDLGLKDVDLTPGQPTAASGAAAVKALEEAVRAISDKYIDVLVTAPISKEAVQSESFAFPGHTEFLNACAGEEYKAQMILFDDRLRVALVTTHLAIADVPAAITKERVLDSVRTFDKVLRKDFAVTRPKIAVLALNPHCGDGGLLGNEEKEVIAPALADAAEEGLLAFGPFAADGFFAGESRNKYDGVIAMYHDQGLAPFKALAGEFGVNFTAGLPWVRTSPDHGTAYDKAWKDMASEVSMREAIYKAIDIFRCRRTFLEASENPLRKMKPEKADKGEKGEKSEKVEKSEKREKQERSEKSEQAGNAGKNDCEKNDKGKYDRKPGSENHGKDKKNGGETPVGDEIVKEEE